jgi:hypothetical protein
MSVLNRKKNISYFKPKTMKYCLMSPFESLCTGGKESKTHSCSRNIANSAQKPIDPFLDHRAIQDEIFQIFHDTFQQSQGSFSNAMLQITAYRCFKNIPQSLCACAVITAYIQYIIERYLLRYIENAQDAKREIDAGLRKLCKKCGSWITQIDKDLLLDHLKITMFEQLYLHSQNMCEKNQVMKFATWQPELTKGLRRRVRRLGGSNDGSGILSKKHCEKFFNFIFPTTLACLYQIDVFDELNFEEWYTQVGEDLESDQSSSSSGGFTQDVIQKLMSRIETNSAALDSTKSLMKWLETEGESSSEESSE